MKSTSAMSCRMIFALSVILLLVTCIGEVAASLDTVDKVVVIKSERKMVLLKRGTVFRSFDVALGRNPVGPKVRQGDHRTPEGTYLLDWRNGQSRFYRSIHISYPSEADLRNARKQGVPAGGDIMIHGLPKGKESVGELHTLVNWTKGCIAVTNAEMDEIWRVVPDGTPIEIRP